VDIHCWVDHLFNNISINKAAYTFTVNISSTPKDVYPFWQSCTTFDHALSALRSDFQQQLTQTRFHSIFDDSIGILNPRKPTTGNCNSPYSYVNVDKIYDFLQSINILNHWLKWILFHLIWFKIIKHIYQICMNILFILDHQQIKQNGINL